MNYWFKNTAGLYSLICTFKVCLVGVKIGRIENRVENGIFHCLIEERKQKRQRIGGKFFTPDSPFFILPIWEENEEKKVLKDALYTNTLNLSCIFFLSSLFCRQQRCPTFFFFFSFWATTLPVMLPPFFFFSLFLGSHVARCHFFFFLGINIAYFFFFFYFFYFLGLGCDSLFLFLLTVIFFLTCFLFL